MMRFQQEAGKGIVHLIQGKSRKETEDCGGGVAIGKEKNGKPTKTPRRS